MTRLGKTVAVNLLLVAVFSIAVWGGYDWGYRSCLADFNAAALACDEEQGDG